MAEVLPGLHLALHRTGHRLRLAGKGGAQLLVPIVECRKERRAHLLQPGSLRFGLFLQAPVAGVQLFPEAAVPRLDVFPQLAEPPPGLRREVAEGGLDLEERRPERLVDRRVEDPLVARDDPEGSQGKLLHAPETGVRREGRLDEPGGVLEDGPGSGEARAAARSGARPRAGSGG